MMRQKIPLLSGGIFPILKYTLMKPLSWQFINLPILLIVALFFSLQRADSNIVISEIMAVADLNYPDDDGEPSDWIELTNKGGAPFP